MIRVKALPPEDALAFWRDRMPVTAQQFAALSKDAQQRAWTVSGLMRRELVEAVHASLQTAMQEGKSLQAWKREARALLGAEGEKGETPAALLRDHRLDTIFRTNLQTAYQAGRYAQLQESTRLRPYWRYSAVRDLRVRPEHALLHGLVYPHDHQFWDQYYPPNGFNCRCTVQSLSASEVEQRGLTVQEELPGTQEWVDPVSKKKRQVLPAPDPGFGGNVGRDWLAGLSPRELDGELTPLPGPTLCREGKGLFALGDCLIPIHEVEDRHFWRFSEKDLLPHGMNDTRYIEAFLEEFGSKDGKSVLVTVPGTSAPLVVGDTLFRDRKTVTWKVRKRGRERYLRLLAKTIQEPWEVWEAPAQIGFKGKTVTVSALTLIRLWIDEGQRIGGLCVFRMLGGNQWTGVTAFQPGQSEEDMLEYLERERRELFISGSLLYREP